MSEPRPVLRLARVDNTGLVELARVSRVAKNAIAAIRAISGTDNELFETLSRTIGYGRADLRLRTFCRELQKALEHDRQKKTMARGRCERPTGRRH
jgi:hypothetical protein